MNLRDFKFKCKGFNLDEADNEVDANATLTEQQNFEEFSAPGNNFLKLTVSIINLDLSFNYIDRSQIGTFSGGSTLVSSFEKTPKLSKFN